MQDIKEFTKAVKDMRSHQKAFFSRKTLQEEKHTHLLEAKKLEKLVDDFIEREEQQPNLFTS